MADKQTISIKKMARIAGYGLLSILGILVLFAVGARIYLDTEAGHNFLQNTLTEELSGPDQQIHIGTIEGSVFTRFSIEAITIADSQGKIADIGPTHIEWSPWALLNGTASVQMLDVEHARLLRLPRSGDEETSITNENDTRFLPELPVAIQLDNFTLQNVEIAEAVLGTGGVVGVEGGLTLKENDLRLVLALNEQSKNLDAVDISFVYIKADDVFDAKVDLRAQPGGLLLAAIGIEQPLFLSVSGQGPASNWNGDATLTLDQTTALNAALKNTSDRFSVKGNANLGVIAPENLPPVLQQNIDFTLDARTPNSNGFRQIDLAIDGGGDELSLSGGFNLENDLRFENTRIQAHVGRKGTLVTALPGGVSLRSLKLEGLLNGALERPELDADITIADLAYEGNQSETLKLRVQAAETGNKWHLAFDGSFSGIKPADETLTALLTEGPLQFSGDVTHSENSVFSFENIDIKNNSMSHRVAGKFAEAGTYSASGVSEIKQAAALKKLATTPLKGTLNAEWSLTGNTANDTLKASATLTTNGFETGIDIVDDLLGKAPAIETALSLDKGLLSLESFSLDGKHIDGNAQGALTADSTLDLTYALRLKQNTGEADIGPLNLAGGAEITGKATGSIEAAEITFGSTLQMLDMQGFIVEGLRLDGSVALGAGDTRVTLNADGASSLGDVALEAILISGQSGDTRLETATLTLGELNAEAENLNLTDGRANGSINVAGRLAPPLDNTLNLPAIDTIDATLSLTENNDLRLSANLGNIQYGDYRLETLSANMNGTLNAANFEIRAADQADLGLNLSLDGTFKREDDDVISVTTLVNGSVADQPIDSAEALSFTLSPQNTNLSIKTLRFGGAVINAQYAQDPAGTAMDLNIKALAGRVITAFVPEWNTAGQFDVSASLNTKEDTPSGSFTIEGRNLRSLYPRIEEDNAVITTSIQGNIVENALDVAAQFGFPENDSGEFKAKLPLKFTNDGLPITLDREAPLSANARWNGPVAPLWRMIVQEDDELSGDLKTELNVEGSLVSPSVTGTITFSSGRYENILLGGVADDIEAKVTLAGRSITLESLTATDGRDGTINGSGSLALGEDYSLSSTRIELELNDAAVMRRADASARVSANLIFENSDGPTDFTLEGDLTVRRAEFRIPDQLPQSIVPLEVIEVNGSAIEATVNTAQDRGRGATVALGVSVRSNGRFFVRGRGLDSEWKGNLRVGGTSEQPTIIGTIDLVEGLYSFANKNFNLTSGTLQFDGSKRIDPFVNLVAQFQSTAITATLTLSGRLQNPEIELTSIPDLPQDEILSRILFDSAVTELTPLELFELASAIGTLSGRGSLDAIGRVRRFTQLDRLSIESGEDDEGTRVTGGKYLTKNVYLSLSAATGTGETAASIEVKLTKNLSIASRVDSAQDNSLRIRWSWDY